jgi:hypothetical protein
MIIKMNRVSVSEVHEQRWFPKTLRNGVTDALQSIFKVGNIYRSIVPRLGHAVEVAAADRIVDLCSGGGGPWTWLHRVLQQKTPIRLEIWLTDKYPNISAFETARKESDGAIHYCDESINAISIPQRLLGFRTVFTSFHHFSAHEVVAILQNAIDARQGIGVFEAARRRPLTILLTILMLFAGFVTAPFIRPFRPSLLIWTYLVPVIPLVLWFDGILSCLRAYSPDELSQLVSRTTAKDYTWEIGEERGWLTPITYLVGYPNTGNAGGNVQRA